jgi:hypothetical protein
LRTVDANISQQIPQAQPGVLPGADATASSAGNSDWATGDSPLGFHFTGGSNRFSSQKTGCRCRAERRFQEIRLPEPGTTRNRLNPAIGHARDWLVSA